VRARPVAPVSSLRVARTVDEPFLEFEEETLWWEERAEHALPAVVPARRRVRRPPPRTLAGDLARLRAALARREQLLPAAALAAFLGLVAVVALLRVATGGDEAKESPPAPAAAPAADPAPGPAAVPRAARLLRVGDSGADVRDLQQALAALGYYTSSADGAFGEGTAAAVGAFQGANGLLADGIVGATTAAALREAVAARAVVDTGSAEEGLAAAVDAGRLDPQAAARHRETLAAATAALDALPPGRGSLVAAVLRDVAVHADVYDGPRARSLFGMLAANVRHLERKPAPAEPGDIADGDGVVYRFFRGPGFQFHPLANFIHLNRSAGRGERERAARHAKALVARGVPSGDALAWEYFFPFGGPPRWTSGLAQAVGAQALARAGVLAEDASLLRSARAAYRMLPKELSRPLASGTWVREYGFSDAAILNAQLQSIVSLLEYVELTGDTDAQAFTGRMLASARDLLPQFDTGCWSLYSLDGASASPSYHDFHIKLLRRLARLDEDPLWRETANRWAGYRRRGGPC
jgi:D-glucuronyl C5-epimerase C-terminus/Putative peptidoglycan binding domain